MTREIGFYKTEEDRWYAHLPEFIAIGGTEAECEMVSGADAYLQAHSLNYLGSYNYVKFKISDTEELKQTLILLETDSSGAYYFIEDTDLKVKQMLWLCPVTLSVFNKYPEKIFIEPIEKRFNFKPNYDKVSFFKRIYHILKISPRIIKKIIFRRL